MAAPRGGVSGDAIAVYFGDLRFCGSANRRLHVITLSILNRKYFTESGHSAAIGIVQFLSIRAPFWRNAAPADTCHAPPVQ